jgi:3-hydroxyacyl-CoA dehydrogenase/enoyl-CoA hydratase/3-hydroxybutyryl-CoA epimerase
MTDAFRIDISEGIANVTFDLPGKKVNILDPGVIVQFDDLLAELEGKAADLKGVIILSGKERNFIAGADIDVIGAVESPEEGRAIAEEGQRVLARLENLPLPVAAAIHGACLGGGLELALACTWRVASDARPTFLGLPETQLGILPGFGGTQRLPRLVGLPDALWMITTGGRVYPKKALGMGLVDEVTHREHLRDAAGSLIGRGPRGTGRSRPRSLTGRLLRLLLESNRYGRGLLFEKAKDEVRRKWGGHYPAPPAAIGAMEEGLTHGMARGLEEEARRLGELVVTPECRNLIEVFRLRQHFAGVDPAPAAGISRLGVIGAGVMGGGIAALAAGKGVRARIVDLSPRALGGALRTVAGSAGKKHRQGVLSDGELSWVPARITYDTAMRGLGGLHLIIEAVAERMDVKKSVLAGIADGAAEDAVIVSNTSSLSVTEMAAGVKNPSRVAGMHFFNPVDRMPLVEVVMGEKTSEETAEVVRAFAKRLGKVPIVVRDGPGFLVNRLLLPYLNEGARLLEEGTALARIDGALEKFGMPMGPFALLDTVGIDIASHAAENLGRGLGDRFQPSALLAVMAGGSRLGRKTGRGFYFYGKDGERRRDSGLEDFLSGHVTGGTEASEEEIVDRLILSMVNEASLCLEEGVVKDVRTVDGGMILGAGFPPFRGGLLRYADSLGLDRTAGKLKDLSETAGHRFAPSEMIRELARSGGDFYGP